MKIIFAFVLGLLVWGLGCKQNDPSPAPVSFGNITVLATDDPFPFSSVASAKITVDEIKFLREGSESTVISFKDKVTMDLLQLRNGITRAIVNRSIPEGSYDQLRIVISSATLDLKDGSHFDLKVPSGSESGIKVHFSSPVRVAANGTASILLDFDLSRSFVATGGGFIFKPVIRSADLSVSGVVGGKVLSDNGTIAASDDFALEGTLVTLSRDGVAISTAFTDAQGLYKIIGVEAGRYELAFIAPGYAEKKIDSVSIAAESSWTEDVTLNKISAELPPEN